MSDDYAPPPPAPVVVDQGPLARVVVAVDLTVSEPCYQWLLVECEGRGLTLDALASAVVDYWTYQQGRRPLSPLARRVR